MGYRAQSKTPIRKHLKKHHAEEFKVALVPEGSPHRYRCCEIDFDIESWADHFVDHHYHSTNMAASVPLSPTRLSCSFQYTSISAPSSNPNGRDSQYQVAIGSGMSGHEHVSNAGSQRQASYRDRDLSQCIDTPRSFEKSSPPVSQSHLPSVQAYLLRKLTSTTPSIGVYYRQILFAEDAFGNVLFDDHNNKVVRKYNWQQEFALDGAGNLVMMEVAFRFPYLAGSCYKHIQTLAIGSSTIMALT